MLPKTIDELHLIDGFDIPKTPSESYSIEVDFGPSTNPPRPGLIDVEGGEYIDALRSSVEAYSQMRKTVLRTISLEPHEKTIGIIAGERYHFYNVSPYDTIEVVGASSENSQPEPVIDYGSITMAGAKVSLRLAGKSEEHPDWGGTPNTRYAVVFKIVTNWDNVYWRVGFVTVNQEVP